MLNRIFKYVTIVLSFSFFFSSAHADYVKANLGLFLVDGSMGLGQDSSSGLGIYTDLDSEVASPITLIYGLELKENFILEVDISYRKNPAERDEETKFSVLSLGATAIHRFMPSSPLQPYIGAGLSIGNYKVESTTEEDDAMAFAVQSLAGLNYMVTDQWGIGVEGRHFASLFGPKFSISSTDFLSTYKHFAIALTASYKFK